MEHDKRIRREIANSNERRRMQSINAGFQSLRSLLPQHEGEKLSKAAILQQTADFICELDSEKSKLVSQNSHLKRLLAAMPGNSGATGDSGSATGTTTTGSLYTQPHSPAGEIPPSIVKRRKTMDGAVESGDEGIGSMSPDHSGSGEESRGELNELRRETMDLRLQLERERRHRVSLEEHIAILQQQQTIYVRKLEQDQPEEGMDEVDSAYQVPMPEQTVRVIHDKTPRCFTIRNNLETIVEAIRHLEGDHLFSDDRNHSSSSSPSSPSDSPRQMEICSSGSSPSPQESSCRSMELPMVEIQIPASTSPGPALVGTETVTSIKHQILNRLSHNSADPEEQPINLEFRPSSRSPSPELILPTIITTSPSTLPPLTIQYHQLRPGVIVVKQNS